MISDVKHLAPLLWEEIEQAKRIILHLHPSPDGDSVGSALGMMGLLEMAGKRVTVLGGDSKPPQYLSELPGFDKIISVRAGEFKWQIGDLFIVQDASAVNQISKIDTFLLPDFITTVVIDHHVANAITAKLKLIDTSYVATAQMVYDLAKSWKLKITPEIAINLFIGIYTDSGGFKYYPTSSKTLAVASKLAAINPKFSDFIFKIENNNEPERLIFLGLALNSIELFYGGNVALVALTFEQLKEKNLLGEGGDKSDIANMLKSVNGWNIGVCMTEKEPGVIGVSLRTRDAKKFDVSQIALATGTGGGHPAAAGATIRLPLAEAKKYLLAKISEVYPFLVKK